MPHDFDQITPDFILDAIEGVGFLSDYRVLELNSYENRVYQVGLDEGGFVVAKFYRPGRWSEEQIQEELDFTQALFDHEIPSVPALYKDESNLHQHKGFFFTVCPRRGGRHLEIDNLDHVFRLGQFLGRIHAFSSSQAFKHRPALNTNTFGGDSIKYVLQSDLLPPHMAQRYQSIGEELLTACQERFTLISPTFIPTHGDCHPGNVLWTDAGPHFVDFDDARMAPAVQDLWMMLSGEQKDMQLQVDELLAGYEEFNEFNRAELALIEPLRTLRMIHYAAWLARRWDDPAFPKAFPWFGSEKYWEEHIMNLEQQATAIEQRTAAYFCY